MMGATLAVFARSLAKEGHTVDFDTIVKLAQLGTSGVLLVILLQLWTEFRVQNQFIREMLLAADKDRNAIAQAVGAKPVNKETD